MEVIHDFDQILQFRSDFAFFSNLVVQDKIENLLYQHLGFREGDEKQKINSEDQARILDANSRENSRQCLD